MFGCVGEADGGCRSGSAEQSPVAGILLALLLAAGMFILLVSQQ
jgi:hypothetical protein